MSPLEIQNPKAYLDRTVQDWHRQTFGTSDWAIDIDLMGACSRCREPLYLIEASQDPLKPTTIIQRLSERAGVPAYLVLHANGHITAGRTIEPMSVLFTPAELVDEFKRIRTIHEGHHS